MKEKTKVTVMEVEVPRYPRYLCVDGKTGSDHGCGNSSVTNAVGEILNGRTPLDTTEARTRSSWPPMLAVNTMVPTHCPSTHQTTITGGLKSVVTMSTMPNSLLHPWVSYLKTTNCKQPKRWVALSWRPCWKWVSTNAPHPIQHMRLGIS